MINQLGKGLIPDSPDERDYKLESLAAPQPVDWDIPFCVPEPRDEDQGTSDACVAYGCSYYHETIKPNHEFSRRDLFARIALGYGAQLRDGVKAIVKQGQATQDEVPDPEHPTPQNMRDTTGIDPNKEADDKELDYWSVPNNIDSCAQTIRDYNGCLFGVQGSNEGWKDLLNPRPPFPNEVVWGHALYGKGYHIHDNQKCIIAKSSWCNTVKEHHIKEPYFLTDNTFCAWTLLPKQLTNKPMYKKIVYADGKTFGVLVITPNGSQIINATSEDVWKSFSRPDSYQLTTVNADGTTNFSTDDCIKLPW